MAIRDDFTAGEVLAAADLNDTFASKISYSYGTATPSTTVDGFVWYDENSTPPAPKFWDGAAFQALGGGKVLQVVRATDATARTTTSVLPTYVDANLSVTITPQRSTSALILLASYYISGPTNQQIFFRITDSSNNPLSGAERSTYYDSNADMQTQANFIGYVTPASVAALTYKVRFCVSAGTGTLNNNLNTGQLYAIEVSA